MHLRWKQEYEIGIPKIDEQHQGLMALINSLDDFRDKNPDARDIFNVLNAMIKYAETHFVTEEKYMKLLKYPKFDAHAQVHVAFIERVMLFAQQLEQNNPRIFSDLLDFLLSWYQHHIGGVDREYRDYFLANKSMLLKADFVNPKPE
jgi:hemerythrin